MTPRKSTSSSAKAAAGSDIRKSSIGAGAAKKRPIEQYDHKDKKRVNNPPVGLVTEATDKESGKKKYAYDPHIDPALQFDSQRSEVENIIDAGLSAQTLEQAKEALAELKKRQEPYLNWAGKAERTSFEVPTVSLHVHERIDPKSIIQAVKKRNGTQTQTSFFEALDEKPPLREAVEFYKHRHNWSNRLIAGDSLLVMNSLIEKEGLAGQVQMIYLDPPYGIKYGSNFQPFVNKREVKEGRDEDLTQEPEMVKAFRDTWELGIHSFLTYLKDRIRLSHELLSNTGSLFVQISDDNIHHVRELADEVFGSRNFCKIIAFRTTAGDTSTLLPTMGDFLLWYAKDIKNVKYRRCLVEKELGVGSGDMYDWIESAERSVVRKMSLDEKRNISLIPKGWRAFRIADLKRSGFSKTATIEFTFNDRTFFPGQTHQWKTNLEGLYRLAAAGWLIATSDTLSYKRYFDDFPASELGTMWHDTQGATGKIYAVQTSTKVIQRSLLMTTDPGDLVFDPTCGSGTTAFVAEQWGRRWITCDTSRVAVALAKQRLMTSVFDYYELAYPDQGIGSGFRYKTVPHITLKSIANNEPPGQETLYDQPFVDNGKTRVTGPFTVEAVPAPLVKPLADIGAEPISDASVARTGETLRQSEWKDELFKTGIRGKAGQRIDFSRVETLPGTRYLHAEAETKEATPQRVVVSFGPEHAPLEQRQVEAAIEEARTLVPKPKMIVFAAFQFDPEAAKDIDETNWPGVTLLKAQMNTDLLTDDLKKKRSSNESFWLIGQPDIVLRELKENKKHAGYQVSLLGFDYYNTKSGAVESGGTEKIAMWMLDPDYDGRSLFPKQVFFPMAGADEGWTKLAKNLKAEIDPELIEKYRGTTSLPFEAGEHRRIAVKIIDDRGIESLIVKELDS